ncbi:hypothetical protein PIB30_092293 [Stylosanthes scabra]|uniref:Protein PHYTOCHROME KINASE SUBSTRATE 4 n=1 Tax=Stylosanthes scabra TaxID=79078 RepID=A0ABU6YV58_9FABA|nr:hypothetical protein [Stylosanthes scabra]
METTTTTVLKPIPIPIPNSSPPPTMMMRTRDRDASFSSYLKPHHLLHSHHHDDDDNESTTELSIFDAHKYFNSEDNNNNNDIPKVTIITNSSIRVSPLSNIDNAEKPSNAIGTTPAVTRYSSASSSVDGGGGYAGIRSYRARSMNGGTATPSEASWNSQAGLLSHANSNSGGGGDGIQPSNDLSKKLKASLSKPIWILRRKCPCRGKKSVQVKEYTAKVPQPPPQLAEPPEAAPKNPKSVSIIAPTKNWVAENDVVTASNSNSSSKRFHTHRVVASTPLARVPFTDGFTFPVLNAKPHARNGVVSRQERGDEDDQLPRDSLEVFQPPDDVEPSSDSPQGRVVGGGGDEDDDDDAASDASSDLFEIESFSTGGAMQPTCPVVFRREAGSSGGNGFFYGGRRRSMDEGSTATMTECYEPSEASVEWSVTTAEGYYEESVVDGGGGGGVDVRAETVGEKWKKKGGSSLSGNGGLLMGGCRSEKAVSVGREAQASVRKLGGGGESGARCGSKHVNVNVNVKNMNMIVNGGSTSRVALGSCNKPPLPLPHHSTNTTPCISLAFAT